MTPRIAILVPTGWCVRNFVRTSFLDTINQEANVTLISPLAKEAVFQAEMKAKGVTVENFPLTEKGRLEPFVEEFSKYCYFQRQQTNIARFFLDQSYSNDRDLRWRSKIFRSLLIYGSTAVGRVASPRLLPTLERRLWQMQHGLEIEKRLLDRLNPDLIVSTMPLSHTLERPLLWAAEQLGISRACVVQSWDNIYSKGMFPVEFDRYIVWSAHMKSEMARQYPDIDASHIVACGALQFDFYQNSNLVLPREEFFKRIGADLSRPLLVWAGVTPGLMPNEPNAVALLCEEVGDDRVRGNPQLLLRPHPIGGGARFAALRQRHPELLFTETNEHDPQKLIHWSPTVDDMVMQANTVAHADVNINVASTMTLDSCVFDRPVVNIAFDEREPGKSSERLRRFYAFEHYQTVLRAGAARVAKTVDELTQNLNRYLEDPTLEQQNRARLVELHCGHVDGHAAQRTVANILDVVHSTAGFRPLAVETSALPEVQST